MHVKEVAKEICKKLSEHGFIAYFAGGSVRDELLGNPSDDVDIATSASPEQICVLFPQHVLIGAQFGIVLVLYKGHQFEVASFRSDLAYVDGRAPTGVVLNISPEEDAARRDFTINGLFYDPATNTILDYCHGQEDLKKGIVRTIGNPFDRFQEDRLRMIRAIRFEAKLGFTIEEETEAAIEAMASTLLPAVSMERIFQELTKMRNGPRFKEALIHMHALGLLQTIFKPLQKIPTERLAQRIAGIETLSSDVPTILFLAHLFGSSDEAYTLSLHEHLKGSREDGRFLEFFLQLRKEELPTISAYTLVKYMADSRFEICVEALLLSKEKNETILARKNELQFHIDNLVTKKPLVSSQDLIKIGILPGKEMGAWLRTAEEIAINNNLRTKEEVLAQLHKRN